MQMVKKRMGCGGCIRSTLGLFFICVLYCIPRLSCAEQGGSLEKGLNPVGLHSLCQLKPWLSGVPLVLLMVAVVAVLLGAAAWILRRLVGERTAELTEANRRLQHEVAERVQVESAMCEREENYSNLVGCAFDAIMLFGMDSRCRSANQQSSDLFGYTLDELLQMDWTTLAHPNDVVKLQRRFQDRVMGLPAPTRYEALFRSKAGRELPLEVSVRQSVWRGEDVFIVLFRDMSERKRLETEILKISEWERARIGQDLHDSIGQQLTGLAFLSEVVGNELKAEGSPHQEEIEKICAYLKASHGQLRQIVQGLLPLNLAGGLASGLQRLAESAEATLGIDCFFNDELELDSLSPTIATHLYHIAQEAVANAVRHGVAHQVDITLRPSGERGELVIKDDGTGSCPDEDNNHGSGLKIMRYRADLIGGKLAITRNRGTCGLTVRCAFDLESGARPKQEVRNEE